MARTSPHRRRQHLLRRQEALLRACASLVARSGINSVVSRASLCGRNTSNGGANMILGGAPPGSDDAVHRAISAGYLCGRRRP